MNSIYFLKDNTYLAGHLSSFNCSLIAPKAIFFTCFYFFIYTQNRSPTAGVAPIATAAASDLSHLAAAMDEAESG
jgi:hypothetical protein